MSDKATANISCSILPSGIRSRFSGNLNYSPSSAISATAGTEGWVYVEADVTTSSTALITTSHDYIGSTVAVAADDLIRWICIEHTGTTAGGAKTSEGVVIGLNTTALFSTEGMIFIEPGEMVALKVPNLEAEELLFKTCTISGGVPSGNGLSTVKIKIAAILNNVA